MSNQQYEHYNDHKNEPEIGYHWTVYDSVITDDQLAKLMAPATIENIRRGNPNSTVSFYSTQADSYAILDKIRQFERETVAPVRADLEAKAAAESATGFQTYVATLYVLGCEGFGDRSVIADG